MAMADKKKPKEEERADPNVRYRYIGFEVFPEQKKPFFASEEEKKRYLNHLEEKKKSDEREFSLLFVSSFNRVERAVLFIGAMALVSSPALPWFFLPTPQQGNEMVLGFSLFLAAASQAATIFEASPLAGVGAVLVLLNLVLAPLGGVLLFAALFSKGSNPANPYSRTKKLLGLHFIPFFGYLLIFGLSAAGFTLPGSPLPVFREGFNIFDVFSGAGWGFWAVLVAHLLPAVKSADL